MKDLKSRDGWIGRVARVGLDNGSGGIGATGSPGGCSLVKTDICGAAVSTAGELCSEPEGDLED